MSRPSVVQSRRQTGQDGQIDVEPHLGQSKPRSTQPRWRRLRIARRDDDGTITGDVHGTRGEDWDYAWRWIPPTPVNITPSGPPPTVRQVAHHVAKASDSPPG